MTTRRQVLRGGLAAGAAVAMPAVLRAPPYALLEVTSPATLAREVVGSGADRLFVVAPGAAPLRTLLAGGPINVSSALGPVFGTGQNGRLIGTVFTPLSAFLRAVATWFLPLQTMRFPGFMNLSVYVLARRPRPGH